MIQLLSTIAGLLVMCGIGCVLIQWSVLTVWRAIDERRKKKSDTPFLWRMPADVQAMGRWCSWYFPIIDDIEEWLLARAAGRGCDIGQFRESLWVKYGKREPENETTKN